MVCRDSVLEAQAGPAVGYSPLDTSLADTLHACSPSPLLAVTIAILVLKDTLALSRETTECGISHKEVPLIENRGFLASSSSARESMHVNTSDYEEQHQPSRHVTSSNLSCGLLWLLASSPSKHAGGTSPTDTKPSCSLGSSSAHGLTGLLINMPFWAPRCRTRCLLLRHLSTLVSTPHFVRLMSAGESSLWNHAIDWSEKSRWAPEVSFPVNLFGITPHVIVHTTIKPGGSLDTIGEWLWETPKSEQLPTKLNIGHIVHVPSKRHAQASEYCDCGWGIE
ncbi:hypothetical protein CSOJ01_00599 [Colletotrichum sojae]|uniref:Uncharacterized protein n=1 Tax=Colletotrichum sojae TaxID=2175907 RepID=A0A8H6JXW2_9PEZI|nr:hypothetical protein CSOJ01_00599 [Colletotrichum sojae]